MSHHNSGPRAHALPIGDITDVYVFPAPGREDRLVLVMDLVPFADPDGRFAPELIYRFRARPVTPDPTAAALFAVGGVAEEVVIDCRFTAPENGAQTGTCTLSTGEQVEFPVADEGGSASAHLRVFGGPRWDPFFDDASALVKTITTGKLAFTDSGAILGDGKNVLAIVVEIDTAVFRGSTLLAVVGETLIAGAIPSRWERFGRPELENAILAVQGHDRINSDIELRDLYNSEDVFALADTYADVYRTRLDVNLAFWDGLDGDTAWPLAFTGQHPLRELMLADFQIVDITKPYSENSYLEIERAAVEGREHSTAGGRSPNDACMPTLYTWLVNGGRGPRIIDGVTAASRPTSLRFPYLVAPNPTPPVHGPH